jgi:hypothetical protein
VAGLDISFAIGEEGAVMKWSASALALALSISSGLAAEERSSKRSEFDPPVRLKAGDDFIDSGQYIAHSGPLATDLDGDGKPDLLVGNIRGNIQVYLNRGTREEPQYVEQGLLQAGGEDAIVPNW